jgi:hypothetical protein
MSRWRITEAPPALGLAIVGRRRWREPNPTLRATLDALERAADERGEILDRVIVRDPDGRELVAERVTA